MGAFQPVDSPGTARRLFGQLLRAALYRHPARHPAARQRGDPLASSEVFFYPTLRSDKSDYAPVRHAR